MKTEKIQTIYIHVWVPCGYLIAVFRGEEYQATYRRISIHSLRRAQRAQLKLLQGN